MQIEYNRAGEHQTFQQVDPNESYMYLFGLDRKDKNGSEIDGGDGIVDDNSLLINRYDGILMFPDPYQFNPSPFSRFPIADTADIYNTTHPAELEQSHKYNIIVTSKVNE